MLLLLLLLCTHSPHYLVENPNVKRKHTFIAFFVCNYMRPLLNRLLFSDILCNNIGDETTPAARRATVFQMKSKKNKWHHANQINRIFVFCRSAYSHLDLYANAFWFGNVSGGGGDGTSHYKTSSVVCVCMNNWYYAFAFYVDQNYHEHAHISNRMHTFVYTAAIDAIYGWNET